MIVCPTCGGPTDVTETRSKPPNATRRARRCMDRACEGRVSTIEIVFPKHLRAQDVVFVSRRVMDKLRRAMSVLTQEGT